MTADVTQENVHQEIANLIRYIEETKTSSDVPARLHAIRVMLADLDDHINSLCTGLRETMDTLVGLIDQLGVQ